MKGNDWSVHKDYNVSIVHNSTIEHDNSVDFDKYEEIEVIRKPFKPTQH